MEERATRRFVRLFAALLLVVSAPAYGEIVFNHQPPPSAPAHTDLRLSAVIAGVDDGSTVFIYHRPAHEGDYLWIESEVIGGRVEATIPGEYVEAPGLEYYLAAVDAEGVVFAYPEGAPITPPFLVRVSADTPILGTAPRIEILAPDADASLDRSELVVVIAFSDEEGDLDPAGITFLVNGRDVTREATITPDVLTWLATEDTPRGTLRIEVTAVDLAGNRAEPASISFYVMHGATPLPSEKVSPGIEAPTGRIVLDSRFTDLEGDGTSSRQEPVRTLIGRLDARGRLGFLDYRVKVFRTSDESSDTQPRNRLLVDLDAGPVRARLGDVNPRINPLVIWGKRLRGGALDLQVGHVFAQALYGTTRRAVEGTGRDTLGGERLIVEEAGTFERTLRGVRLGVGAGYPMTLSLSALRLKDDIKSITYGLKPKDNAVVGADLGMRFFGRRLLIDAAAALSWLTEDISGGALTKEEADTTYGIDLPIDPEDLEDVLILNTSTAPLDPRELSNLALQATARGNAYGNLFEVRLRRIGSVYRSLASTSLPQDHQGIRLKDTIGFWRRRIRLTGEYETFKNNLSNDQIHTRTTDILGANVAFTPRSGVLTGLRAGFRLYDQANGDTTRAEGVDNSTLLLNLGGDVRFPVAGFTQTLRTMYYITDRTDEISGEGESEGSNLILEFATTFPQQPLSIGALLGFATNRYPGLTGADGAPGVDADFTTLQLTADYRARRIPIRATWRRVDGEGNMAGAHSLRSSLSLNAEYRFDFGAILSARAGLTQFDDRSDADQDYDETFVRMSFEERF